MINTPISAIRNKLSAILSSRLSLAVFVVLIERYEKIQENVSTVATTDVNSSVRCLSVRLAICKEVITKRQKPKRFAAVFNICGDVLFAIAAFGNIKTYLTSKICYLTSPIASSLPQEKSVIRLTSALWPDAVFRIAKSTT